MINYSNLVLFALLAFIMVSCQESQIQEDVLIVNNRVTLELGKEIDSVFLKAHRIIPEQTSNYEDILLIPRDSSYESLRLILSDGLIQFVRLDIFNTSTNEIYIKHKCQGQEVIRAISQIENPSVFETICGTTTTMNKLEHKRIIRLFYNDILEYSKVLTSY